METTDQVVEQIIRPTGLLDPQIEVRPIKGQIDDLLGEIHKVTGQKERVLVTTLTKKMAEDLTEYLPPPGDPGPVPPFGHCHHRTGGNHP